MNCDDCQEPRPIHVTEITEIEGEAGEAPRTCVQEFHLCEGCPKAANLHKSPAPPKKMEDIWKLLQMSYQQTLRRPAISCARCGMSLDDFRRKGRLGCAACYERFRPHIDELLERVHGAKQHVGRIPGLSPDELDRLQRVTDLQQKLEIAIREEAYESAARIRDELRGLEQAEHEG